MFLEEFFKEVTALQNGEPVKASQHKLFMQQLIQAGIKGNTPAKRLVLQHFEAVEARRQVQEALKLKKAAEPRSPEAERMFLNARSMHNFMNTPGGAIYRPPR